MSVSFALLAAAAVAFPTGTFNCVMEPPRWFLEGPKGPEVRNLNFPDLKPADWNFSVEFGSKFGVRITPASGDPLGLSGEHGLVATGENSFALASYSFRNCVLTDGGCATVLQIVPQPDHSLKLLALPSAIIFLDGDKTPTPFNALAPGKCLPQETSK